MLVWSPKSRLPVFVCPAGDRGRVVTLEGASPYVTSRDGRVRAAGANAPRAYNSQSGPRPRRPPRAAADTKSTRGTGRDRAKAARRRAARVTTLSEYVAPSCPEKFPAWLVMVTSATPLIASGRWPNRSSFGLPPPRPLRVGTLEARSGDAHRRVMALLARPGRGVRACTSRSARGAHVQRCPWPRRREAGRQRVAPVTSRRRGPARVAYRGGSPVLPRRELHACSC